METYRIIYSSNINSKGLASERALLPPIGLPSEVTNSIYQQDRSILAELIGFSAAQFSRDKSTARTSGRSRVDIPRFGSKDQSPLLSKLFWVEIQMNPDITAGKLEDPEYNIDSGTCELISLSQDRRLHLRSSL